LDTTSSARVLEYNVSTPASSVSLSPAGGGSPYGIAIDGNNNVFYTHESSSATATVEEFLGGNLASTSEVEYGLYSPGGTNQEPEYAALDSSGNLWMTNGSSTAGLEQNILQMSGYNGSTACTAFPCTASTSGDTTLTQTYTDMVSATGGVPTLSEPFGIAAGKAGTGVWLANEGGTNTVTNMTSTTAGTNYGSATSLNKPQYIAVDGVGNVWVTNGGTATNGSVSELAGSGSSVGTILSPVNTGGSFTAVGFVHPAIQTAEGVAIDPSGNIWIASQVAATGGVFEIVGAAAPTVTPIALALKNSAIGAKP
jgi:streptogramin lyase